MSYEELEGIGDTSVESLRMVWNSWSQDPIKATILRAVLPYMTRHPLMGAALCQKEVFSSSSTNGREKLITEMLLDLGWAWTLLRFQRTSQIS